MNQVFQFIVAWKRRSLPEGFLDWASKFYEMDSELMDRVKHLARDGVSAEFKIFGKAIVALVEENERLRDSLKEMREEAKEAKQEMKEMIKASAGGGGTGTPASAGLRRPVFKRPGAPDEDGESEESEEMEGEEGEEAEKPAGPSVPLPPSLGAFGD